MKNKKFLPGHPAIFVISLVLAVIIWFLIMNVADPVQSRTFTGIEIQFTNQSYIESRGQSLEVPSGAETVSVRVRGNRSVVERIKPTDITAVADLTQIVDFNSKPVMVPVSVTVPGVNEENITVAPRNIEISLEEMKSKEFVLNPTTGESKPAQGYEVGTMEASPEQITIRGSESLINKIDKVNAEVDVSNMKKDGNLPATLKIYDKNGDELSATQRSFLTLGTAESSIYVHTTLYSIDSDVKVTAETSGMPKSGYQVSEIELTPQTISVVGDAKSLAALRAAGNQVTITRRSKAIDVEGASSDVTARVYISEFLPDGITLATDFSSTVVANVKILPYGSKSFSLDTKSVTKKNLGSGLNAVFSDSELDVRVRGSNENLKKLTASQIQASVDLSGKQEGDYTVPVTITLPSGYSLVDSVTADVTISKMTTAPEVSITEDD